MRAQRKIGVFYDQAVGNKRHYKINDIAGRHFIQTAASAGLAESLARDALQEVAEKAGNAMQRIQTRLPPGFPEETHTAVTEGLRSRLQRI